MRFYDIANSKTFKIKINPSVKHKFKIVPIKTILFPISYCFPISLSKFKQHADRHVQNIQTNPWNAIECVSGDENQ